MCDIFYHGWNQDDAERKEDLLISQAAMEFAVELAKIIMQQRIVFEGDAELIHFCQEFWDWELPEGTPGAERPQKDPAAALVKRLVCYSILEWSDVRVRCLSA